VPTHLMLTDALHRNTSINLQKQITAEQIVKHIFPHCNASK